MKCGRLQKGDAPIHWAPSLPIAVIPRMSPTSSGRMKTASTWQPVPAPTVVPAGTPATEELWGHPEQK
ncbi:MAG: hypothetical protein BWY91_01850 [bacterium ADurb.BinA028]|nr:MAG: hypothetical protein BWY91_01850 [bacterium ADurb.BinA028]